MTIRRPNPRHQGDIGVGAAIQWFMENGYRVFAPLSESQPFDLIVEDDEGLYRVQVKTTTHRSRYGIFVVQLSTQGGNQSFHTKRPFDPSRVEILFVLTDDGTRYVIPSEHLGGRTKIHLGRAYRSFRV